MGFHEFIPWPMPHQFLGSSWPCPQLQVCATDHPNVLERVELEAKRVTSSLTLMQQQGLSASGPFGV